MFLITFALHFLEIIKIKNDEKISFDGSCCSYNGFN